MSVAGDQVSNQNDILAGRRQRPWLLASNRKLRHLQGLSFRNLLVTPPPATRARGKTIDDDNIPSTLQTQAKILANRESRSLQHSRSVTDLHRISAPSTTAKTTPGENGEPQRRQGPSIRRRSTLPWSGANPGVRQTRLEDIAASRMADTWFSLHCPGVEESVYESEVVERAMNPSFKSFDLNFLGPLVSRMDRVIVKLWVKPLNMAEYFLLLEVHVHLRSLQYIGKTLENFHHPLPMNSVIFHFVDGVYTGLTDMVSIEEPSLSRPQGQAVPESDKIPTSSYDSLMRLANLDNCIQDALATRDKLEAQINSVLEENKAHLDVIDQKAQAEERLISVKKSVTMEKKRLQQSLNQKESLIASIIARKEAMQQGRENQEKTLSYLHEAQSTKISSEKLLRDTKEESRGQIRRICEDLSSIYPIEPVPGKALAFSILGIPLPNSKFDSIDKESVAAALGYTAHLVYLLSFYLSVPLPYPIQPYSSNSFIQDPISVGISQRTFPLYPVNTHYRFEYGVFLLNKDIEYLLIRQGFRVLDIRHTLPNLKYLLYLLTSASSELPARKAGGVRGLLAGKGFMPDLSRRESTESMASANSALNQKRVWQGAPTILVNGGGVPKPQRHVGDDEDQQCSVTTVMKQTTTTTTTATTTPVTTTPGGTTATPCENGRVENLAFQPGRVQRSALAG